PTCDRGFLGLIPLDRGTQESPVLSLNSHPNRQVALLALDSTDDVRNEQSLVTSNVRGHGDQGEFRQGEGTRADRELLRQSMQLRCDVVPSNQEQDFSTEQAQVDPIPVPPQEV